ncbi:MAG: 2-phospho-L-lactate transferase [Actinomycetota bacterium]|nr:2-phospho-L-lactate transferase [Actinomycetota bacterium]
MRVALLSGGTGGAKLARGLLDEVGAENLTVIANTGDDAWVHGAHVSPDPDLVTYWLANAIDERGYGIRGDSWQVMDALEAAGRPTWFRLGDRDLAMCLIRSELLAAGERLTDAHAAVVSAMGVAARVLPMCDEAAATRIGVRGRVLPFQEFMIVERALGPLQSVEFAGVEAARPTPDVLAALEESEAIVIGPSNPIASIGPILALPGLREALTAATAPVVAVSPFVDGGVLKGPTELFCEFAGVEPSASGVATLYGDLLDGIVADEPVGAGLPALEAPTLMDTSSARRSVAAAVLEFAAGLAAD